MEQFVDELRKFEVIHQWWSPQTFQRLDNQTLKRFVDEQISTCEAFEQLLQTGSTDEFETWIAAILEAAPKMITVVLACILNNLHSLDSANQLLSEQIVAWYRKEGWSFPPFRHEMVQKIEPEDSVCKATNLLYDA